MCKVLYLPFTWDCLHKAHGSELEASKILSCVRKFSANFLLSLLDCIIFLFQIVCWFSFRLQIACYLAEKDDVIGLPGTSCKKSIVTSSFRLHLCGIYQCLCFHPSFSKMPAQNNISIKLQTIKLIICKDKHCITV